MNGGGGTDKEAARAREEEAARQQRVRQGTADINSIFDGRLVGSGAVTGNYDPNATYYNKDGSVWKPQAQTTVTTPASVMPNPAAAVPSQPSAAPSFSSPFTGMGNDGGFPVAVPQQAANYYDGSTNQGMFPGSFQGNNGGATSAAATTTLSGPTAAEQFAQMRGNLFSGQDMAGGFTDAFFRGIRDDYTNYAMPQLNQQRDEAAKGLTFALDRSGQLSGSVRGQKTGELQRLFDLNEQQVRDQALGYENQARTSVENARSDLIGMLNATGDNQQAVNSALSRSTILTQPQQYSPLGQLFTDFTSQLGGQAARERAEAMSGGMYRAPFNTGLFGGTGRVTVR